MSGKDNMATAPKEVKVATTPEEMNAPLFAEVRKKVAKHGNTDAVQSRLEKFANRNTNETPAKENGNKNDKKKKEKDLKETAKQENEYNKKVVEAKKKGVESTTGKDSEKGKEKNKEKDKDKNNEMTPEKQEAKMTEMFSKIKLPSGMEIRQEGPKWNLVTKDSTGNVTVRTDVTDVVNQIDSFNQKVDANNEANRVQNTSQSQVSTLADDNKTKDVTGNNSKVFDEAIAIVENKKDDNGNAVFKPEDVKAVAEAALSFSDEKAKLEKLKDPKALEEMNKREKNSQNEATKLAMQDRGGR